MSFLIEFRFLGNLKTARFIKVCIWNMISQGWKALRLFDLSLLVSQEFIKLQSMPTSTIQKTPSVGTYPSPMDGIGINAWVHFLISNRVQS